MLFEPVQDRRRLSGQLIWFCGWLFVTVVGFALTPNPAGHGTHRQLGLPPCPSILLFSRPCFGCGLTTSFTALLEGDLSQALRAHLLGPLLYVAFTASALAGLYGYLKGLRLASEGRLANAVVVGLTAAVLLFGAVRFATTTHSPLAELPFFRSPSAHR